MNKEQKLVLWIIFQNKDLSHAFFKNNSKEEEMEEGLRLGKNKLCLQYRKQNSTLVLIVQQNYAALTLGGMTFYLNIF